MSHETPAQRKLSACSLNNCRSTMSNRFERETTDDLIQNILRLRLSSYSRLSLRRDLRALARSRPTSTMFSWMNRVVGTSSFGNACHLRPPLLQQRLELGLTMVACRMDQEPLLEGGDGADTSWPPKLWENHLRGRYCGAHRGA